MRLTSGTISDKDTRFSKQLTILALTGSIAYLIFDALMGAHDYLILYALVAVSALISYILIERDKTLYAKMLLLFVINLVVALFGSIETLETGIYFYFVLLSVASLALFGYRHRVVAMIFVGISVTLFGLSFFGDIRLLPKHDLGDEYIRASLFVNFVIILASTILVIYYLIQNNHKAETTLNNQRESLIKATKDLESSQRKFELAIQGSSAGIWDWDIINDYVYVTPKLAEILKRPLNQIQSANLESFENIIHPEDVVIFRNAIQNHLQEKTSFEVEIRIRSSDGSYVWVLDSGQAEWDRNDDPIRMVGTVVDIHEKKIAVEQVREQNKMLAKTNEELDRFVYSTSHDLRAPLSSLLGLINLTEKVDSDIERKEIIEMMRKQIVKLDSYIQDITDFSRNVRVNVEREHFRIKNIVDEALENLKFMEGAQHITFHVEIDPDLKIFTDKNRFKVILHNLISNAVKYKDDSCNSYLKIYMQTGAENYLLHFEDNGIGIEKKHQKKIFDMFYRASEQSRGSGLGLYIVKEIADKIGLELSFKSIMGQGTTFILAVPKLEAVLD